MIKIALIGICLIFLPLSMAQPSESQSPDPESIVKKCIERHGGWKQFSEIHDIYAKMKVQSFSDQGMVESTFYEYYRKPDQLRIEIHPPMDPAVIIGWDGKTIWHLAQDNLEKTDKPEQVERIQESLRFVRLIILTNLLNKGSSLKYEAYRQKKNFGIHVISQMDEEGEKIWLYISDKSYTLLGAEFYLRGSKNVFEVIFTKHQENSG